MKTQLDWGGGGRISETKLVVLGYPNKAQEVVVVVVVMEGLL